VPARTVQPPVQRLMNSVLYGIEPAGVSTGGAAGVSMNI